MKSKEFITEAQDLYPGIIRHMVSQGYKMKGEGMDQVAFLAPNGEILKIFKTTRGTTSGQLSDGQRMGVEWIKYCIANEANPFLPKYSGFESFEYPPNSGEMYLQIRMERLGKLPMKWHIELANMATAIENDTYFEDYLDEQLPEEEGDEDDDWDQPTIDDNAATMMIHLGIDNIKKLWVTMETLYEICGTKNWHWDLHSSNFMIRNDGTPVILDPYFLGSGR